MKTQLLSVLLAPALVMPVLAEKTLVDPNRPLVVAKRSDNPIFPRSMLELGVVEGEARVVVSIDSTGKISDYLVIGYTHPDFANAVLIALKRWEFEPPTLHGQPVSILRELKFQFESRGVVVSMDVSSYVAQRAYQIFSDRYVYRPATLKDLDKIPTPLQTNGPLYPEVLAKSKQSGQATVEFFIDENGAVRMPSVVSADHPDFGVASILAVRDWKFEPPTRHGQPVLLRVQQVFTFR
jgi:TonB family protein